MLGEGSEKTGNEVILTWLNLPATFQTVYEKISVENKDTEGRLGRLSPREFAYGNAGQPFKVLQRTLQAKMQPTDEEIERLFPKETSTEGFLHPASGTTNIDIGSEELMKVVAKLPRDRACGESQLSYDHIKYAVMKDQTAASMLQNTINSVLNNPEKVYGWLY